MEEPKNYEYKNESADHLHAEKNMKCCSHKHCGHILIKIAVVLVIFLLGVCLGAKAGRHHNERYFFKNFSGHGGCAMMRAENKSFSGKSEGCPMMNGKNAFYSSSQCGCGMANGENAIRSTQGGCAMMNEKNSSVFDQSISPITTEKSETSKTTK